MMIVNVNQLASTFDETLHAVKFSAIAMEVVILTQPDPPPKEIAGKSMPVTVVSLISVFD